MINKKYRLIVNGNKLDTTLSKPPVFIAGDEFITAETGYPRIAMEMGKSGKVVVSFTVDKFGKTKDFHVKNRIGFGLDEEAIRVLKFFPDFWLPGILNGVPVDVEVEIPFSFANLGVINKN